MARVPHIGRRRCVPHLGAVLAVLCALMLPAARSTANPLDTHGFGARSVAMGGAATAVASDYSANYYNPAGLAADEQLRLEFGYLYANPDLRLNGGDLDVDRSYGVQGGIVMPGELGRRTIAFSFGVFLPAERISRVRALPQQQPRFVLFDNRPQRLVITTSAAFEVVPELLFVGAGLTYLSDTRGSLDMSGLVQLQDAEDTALFSGVDVDLASVRYASAGLLLTPGDLRIGLGFRDQFFLRLDLTVDVRGDVAPAFGATENLVEDGRFVLVTRSTNLFSPRQLSLGVAWAPEGYTIAADVVWQQWSRFPAPASSIDIELELDPLEFALPPVDDPLDPGFHDIFVGRLGGEVLAVQGDHVDLAVRGGYFYEPSPAPDQPALTNYVDTAKHGASLGIGVGLHGVTDVLPGPVWFDVTGLYVGMVERAYRKDDPADAVGDYDADGRLWGIVTDVSFRF